MRHLEFLDKEHFEKNYRRVPPDPALRQLIDFYWEINFEELLIKYPEGFSDALFPNTGYTYILNMGAPFVMQVDHNRFPMRNDGLLPRYHHIECFHQPGNLIFGIKFKISPVILEKEINFSEYKDLVYPLSYLMDPQIIKAVKAASGFEDRIAVINDHFLQQVKKHEKHKHPANIVSEIMETISDTKEFTKPIEEIAKDYDISSRTLQRYFEKCTGINCKKALQVIRIRKAILALQSDDSTFHYSQFGYYDKSHFCKHLKDFISNDHEQNRELYRKLSEAC